MKVQEIREKFAKFFIGKGHEKIASSPLIPQNDKTLLFANAGMNQFKDYFTGKATPANKRAVTIQKVVRAGGKHNDLENVGLTARHHTFFEMLGNFSFGDYFKEEAILFAWEFLTKELNLPAEKLYVTVHYTDDEAKEIWNKKIGLDESRIFKKGDKDNFWEMGEYGPCGPCSEIFYDHGEAFATPNFTPNEDQDILDDEMRYVEVWNLVFMQFEKTPEGQFNLPNPCVDTGAGLERLAAALQGVYWNYDTDAFTSIINKIEELSGKSYEDEKYTSSMRIVADHIRSSTMLITDGAIPSNEGRGYVLRRIIRRAVRHLKNMQAPAGTMHKLVKVVFDTLGKEYPQNLSNQALAEKLLQLEESKFLETLDQGLKFLDEAIKKDLKDKTLPGESVFKLYDTYGFPVDLTVIILQEKGLNADMDGFSKVMKKRKEESKKTWKGAANIDDKVFHQLKEKHGTTKFDGYENLSLKTKLLAIEDLGEMKGLVFDSTPFYGESGGQAGDVGTIKLDDNVLAHIEDTQKPVEDLFVHFSKDADALEVGQTYELCVDENKRRLTMRNHSATHLLQSALIQVLGDHIKQAGSSVGPDRLRFDFTQPEALSQSQVQQVEDIVNGEIQKGLNVEASEMSMDDALKKGALALFGEKYGDAVRVLQMGSFSTELCGGTHVKNTTDIGLFTITSEASLSSGVRRIEALTSETAFQYLSKRSRLLKQVEQKVRMAENKIVEKIDSLFDEVKSKNREIQQLKDKIQAKESSGLFDNPEELSGGFSFKVAVAPEGADLRKLSDTFVSQYPKGILLLHMQKGGKTSALLRVAKSNKTVDCSKILKESLELLNGRGGGRPDMAQGSGEGGDLAAFEAKVKNLVQETIQ